MSRCVRRSVGTLEQRVPPKAVHVSMIHALGDLRQQMACNARKAGSLVVWLRCGSGRGVKPLFIPNIIIFCGSIRRVWLLSCGQARVCPFDEVYVSARWEECPNSLRARWLDCGFKVMWLLENLEEFMLRAIDVAGLSFCLHGWRCWWWFLGKLFRISSVTRAECWSILLLELQVQVGDCFFFFFWSVMVVGLSFHCNTQHHQVQGRLRSLIATIPSLYQKLQLYKISVTCLPCDRCCKRMYPPCEAKLLTPLRIFSLTYTQHLGEESLFSFTWPTSNASFTIPGVALIQ